MKEEIRTAGDVAARLDFLDDEQERIEKALGQLAGKPGSEEKAEMERVFSETLVAIEAERTEIRKLLMATLEEMY